MMKNRLYLVLTILVVSGLANANEDNNNKASNEKKNPIINLFEAPLKAFQTKPGEAIAVFQPEIVRQTEGNENQTTSWFQAGQSLGSQVSSLTGWLANRLYANQQSSTTPKPDSDDSEILVQVQQIKPNQNNDVEENRQPSPIKVIRVGPAQKNLIRRNEVTSLQNIPPGLSDDDFVDALEDIVEQQRLENERFDDAEEEYDDELEKIEAEEENIPIIINRVLMNSNVRRPNPNRLRQNTRVRNNMNRRPNNGMRKQNGKIRTVQIRRRNNPNRKLVFNTQSVQPVNKRQNVMQTNVVTSSKRGFNNNNNFNNDDDYNDDEIDEEDYSEEDESDNDNNNDKDESDTDEDSDDYSEDDGEEFDSPNSSNSNKRKDDDYEDGQNFIDFQNFEPIEIRPQSANRPIAGFRPIEHVAVGGNGHIDRINQMNQQFPTNAIKRRQQILQLQENRKRQQEREQQKLQEALLSNQHIIIPIHFIPDSIPYSEIVSQVPQAQIQVVAQHHHTVENTGPITSIFDDDDRPNRNPNRNRNQQNNNRRPGNNRNRITQMNQQNNNQQKRKNQNQRFRTTTRKPNRNDDVLYSVNLIAPGPANSGRPTAATARPTRWPGTRRSTPRSSTTPKRQSSIDSFRGEGPIVGVQQDKNRPDASPQSSDSDELQETPAQYVAPAPSLSEDDDDDDEKPQARTQFYLPQRFYQILGSDKYLSVGNNGRFLLKSARSLDLEKNPVSETEHPAKVVETSDEKSSQEKSISSANKEVEEDIVKKADKETVLTEVPKVKVEKLESVQDVKLSEEVQPAQNQEKSAAAEKEIDDGSLSTTTERPFLAKEQIEEHKSSTVAPPVNKVAKVLLRSEVVQEKQNGGRFLVKSQEVKI